MAEIVGTSPVTIQQIENCVMEMSPGLARRISVAFGLDVGQLTAGPSDDPERPRFAMTNIPFTKEGYEAYKKARLQVDRKEVDERLTVFSFVLQVLLDAANETQRYRPFVVALIDTLKKLASEFGLVEQSGEILVNYGVDPNCRYNVLEVLFYVALIEGMGKNRDRVRPRRYGETVKEDKRPLKRIMTVVTPQIAAAQRSSRSDKSPKRLVRRHPQLGHDNVFEKPSNSRRGPTAG